MTWSTFETWAAERGRSSADLLADMERRLEDMGRSLAELRRVLVGPPAESLVGDGDAP
jgi:hypothetical protein